MTSAKSDRINKVGEIDDRGELAVSSSDKVTMTLRPRGSEKLAGSKAMLSYDDKAAAKHGSKPFGYLVVVRDKDGAILHVKGNPASLAKEPESALRLGVGTTFDKRSWEPAGKSSFR